MTSFAEAIKPALTGHILFAAPTGAGKSYAVGAAIEQLRAANKPFIILDTKSVNHIGLAIGKNRLKGLTVFRIFNDSSLTIDDYKKMIREYPFLLIIPAGEISIDALTEEYKKVLRAVQLIKVPRHIIVEETHHYCKSPQKAIPELEWIAREGRGYRIWLWSITQRIQSFPKDLWSNCMWSVLLHMGIARDIAYFSDTMPEFAELNSQLKEHDVLIYDQLHKTTPPYTIVRAADVARTTNHYG